MSRRLFALGGIAALSLAATAGSAHATFFSFASDMNSNAYTFGGTAGAAARSPSRTSAVPTLQFADR